MKMVSAASQATVASMVLALVVQLASLPLTANADVIVDDFESYLSLPNRIALIGQTPPSQPWLRFGGRTFNEVFATSVASQVMSGSVSGFVDITGTTPISFLGPVVEFSFPTTTDLSDVTAVSFLMRSNQPSTSMQVRLALNHGSQMFASVEALPVTSTTNLLTFELNESAMRKVDFSSGATFEGVVRNAFALGFTFERAGSGPATERIIFDDLTLLVPEPASAATVCSCVGLWVLKHRRLNRA